jgi:hypothetical protein
VSSPRPPQHPACGSARGVSVGLERLPRRVTSKAGFETRRHDRFTCSGAIRPMRSARLTLCRRFGPAPCPTHYGGRLATTPSADCYAITLGVATECAARIIIGSGGLLHAFRRGPQSGSRDDHCDLRVRWRIHAFQHGPQFDSHSHTDRMPHSSPRIRTCAFGAQPPHLPCPWTPRASSYGADSPRSWAFYAISVRRLAPLHLGFLQTRPRGLALALG